MYIAALAAVAANSGEGAAIKDNLTYVANSPGDIAKYGGDAFASAAEVLATEGGDVNYIGASGQVDIDASGEMSKGTAQTWKVINGQISADRDARHRSGGRIRRRSADRRIEAGRMRRLRAARHRRDRD